MSANLTLWTSATSLPQQLYKMIIWQYCVWNLLCCPRMAKKIIQIHYIKNINGWAATTPSLHVSSSPVGPGWCLLQWWVSPRGCRCGKASCCPRTLWVSAWTVLELAWGFHNLGTPEVNNNNKATKHKCKQLCNKHFYIFIKHHNFYGYILVQISKLKKGSVWFLNHNLAKKTRVFTRKCCNWAGNLQYNM